MKIGTGTENGKVSENETKTENGTGTQIGTGTEREQRGNERITVYTPDCGEIFMSHL